MFVEIDGDVIGTLQLTNHKSRADAHRFYEKLGFIASYIGMKINLEN